MRPVYVVIDPLYGDLNIVRNFRTAKAMARRYKGGAQIARLSVGLLKREKAHSYSFFYHGNTAESRVGKRADAIYGRYESRYMAPEVKEAEEAEDRAIMADIFGIIHKIMEEDDEDARD